MKIVLFLVSFAVLCSCEYTIGTFEGHPFTVKPPSGKTRFLSILYSIGMYQFDGLNLHEETSGMHLVAYGDFNNDK